MKLTTIASATAAIAVACACSPQNEMESGPGADMAADTLTGVVRRIGNEPFVRTVVQGDDTVFVAGEWEAEIATLAGALVTIVGTPTTGEMPGDYMEVTEYSIDSVDGDVPSVGVLSSDDEGYYIQLAGADVLRLSALSPELAERRGAKVWVVVTDKGVVQRYGIIAIP